MVTAFVAVVLGSSAAVPPGLRSALRAAGASAVLSWPDLVGPGVGERGGEPDDRPAVLLDLDVQPDIEGMTAALAALARETAPDSAADAVIVTIRPVTDTLKLVDGAGTLTGTAERDEHRFVGPPIATRLRVLRSVSDAGPDPVAVLTALAGRGVTVIGVPD